MSVVAGMTCFKWEFLWESNKSLNSRNSWMSLNFQNCALKTLDSVHHKGKRLELGSFTICVTETILREAGIPILPEKRDINNAKIAMRIFTNNTWICIQNKNPKTSIYPGDRTFHKSGYRRAKDQKTPSYRRSPWKGIQNNQIDLQLTTIPNGFQTETYELFDEKYKEHTKVYWRLQKRWKSGLHHSNPCMQNKKKNEKAKQNLQESIYQTGIEQRKSNLNWLVKHIDGHIEGNGTHRKPKNPNSKKNVRQRSEKSILIDNIIHPTETYLPQDLAKWLTIKTIESRNLKWKQSINEMKERMKKPEWTKDTEGPKRKNQGILIRIRTENTRATHSCIIEKCNNKDCPFCNTKLSVEKITRPYPAKNRILLEKSQFCHLLFCINCLEIRIFTEFQFFQ
jgi:hypothetical protein